tara:strand:+ start:3980 stop:5368 length:1389 start_codon:yes stop_codon:yes gene_type:complete
MSNIITTEEFAISREITATETAGDETRLVNEQIKADVELVDFETWLSTYLNTALVYNNPPLSNATIMGEPVDEECQSFFDTLRALLMAGKIQSIVENYRSYTDVMQGKKAYNETLVYEIEKTSPDNSQVIQRVFIPNLEKLTLLRYIDTQVKYDKEYTYEVFAHQFIVGTKYEYISFSNNIKDNFEATFDVQYSPSLKIARIPIFKKSARILDAAPLPPNVELVPYKGIFTEFLINLSGNSGDIEEMPIIITDADADFYKKYREARGIDEDAPIRFANDDASGRFEVYRTDVPPKSYEDFRTNLYAVLGSIDAASASMKSKVESNRKYYYTFRAIDQHDNRSNPSPVYQVEVVENNGMMLFISSIYKFPTIEDKITPARTFQRFLKINPNMIQSLVNVEETFPIDTGPQQPPSAYGVSEVILGKAEQDVWTKNFKLRVTSKHTGRKFDINLTCKTRYSNQDE